MIRSSVDTQAARPQLRLRLRCRGGNLVLMRGPTVKRSTQVQVQRCVAVAGLVTVFGAAIGRDGSAAAQDTTPCAKIATAVERLACYDRALPPPEPASEIVPPGATAAPPARPSPLVEGTTAAPATSSGNDGEPEATSIVVVGMRKYPGRSATFTTDRGDVWIQIGAESVYLPKVPFDAELRPASMGTYFMRPSDHGWRVHVRRSD